MARAKRMAVQKARKATVTSLRLDQRTTNDPAHATRNPKKAMLPHSPGETHTRPVASIIDVMPKFVGLKRCLPLMRMKNLLAMAMNAPVMRRKIESARSRSERESAEIAALFHSNGIRRHREQATCVMRSEERRVGKECRSRWA